MTFYIVNLTWSIIISSEIFLSLSVIEENRQNFLSRKDFTRELSEYSPNFAAAQHSAEAEVDYGFAVVDSC